jgi:transposase
MKKIKIVNHLSDKEVKLHYDECLNPKAKERWHLLWLVQVKKLNAEQASELIGRNHGFGSYWIKQYNEKGISAIILPKTRNPACLEKKVTEEIKAELLDYLQQDVPAEIGGGLWNGPKVKLFLEYKFNVNVTRQTGHALLRECDYTVTTVRPKHKKTPKSEKEKFKKNNLARKSSFSKKSKSDKKDSCICSG